jgi:chromosomal replication initiation ATPase DnaA
VAFARHVAMYLCKQRLKCSFPELGRAFGNRDHTTVMSAVRKIEAQRQSRSGGARAPRGDRAQARRRLTGETARRG